ncbi:hypothetical protein HYS47_02940 [Candidatus Woesearchaeota archaeon]|nr:hypothetical protein [Candidatus Woesearchaeota archaeon]
MVEILHLDNDQRRARFTVETILKSSQTPLVQQWTASVKKISKCNPDPKYLGPVCG